MLSEELRHSRVLTKLSTHMIKAEDALKMQVLQPGRELDNSLQYAKVDSEVFESQSSKFGQKRRRVGVILSPIAVENQVGTSFQAGKGVQ